MRKLEEVIFEEFDKMKITPTNSEWKMMSVMSNAIEKWICEEFADALQEWLIKDYEPAKIKFMYNMIKEFPKTFSTYISNENSNYNESEVIETEYEEIKD